MLAGLGGAGAGAGGLTGLSHTAGFNQLQPQDVGEDVQDFQEIDAKPIQTQGQDLTTDIYQLKKRGVPIQNYPHISIDLYGDTKDIVYHAPLVTSEEENANSQEGNANGNLIVCLGQHIDGNVCIKRTEQSYKILKKFLRSDASEELYEQVLDHCLDTSSSTNDDSSVCIVKEPYLLLGSRRIELLNDNTLSKYSIIKSSSNTTASTAIEPLIETNEEKDTNSNVYIRNQTLDGNNISNNNDFDRVAFQIHVLDNKKPLFILPEEIVSLQLAKVRKIVQDDMKVRFNHEEEENVSFLDYPIGLPIPSWIFTDALSEAVLDACNVVKSTTGYTMSNKELHNHRCLSVINGEIIRIFNGTGGNDVNKLVQAVRKYFPKQQKKFSDEQEESEELESTDSLPIIHFIGITSNGIEGVSIQISEDMSYIKCLSESAYQSNNPYDDNDIKKVLKDLKSATSKLVPKKYRKPTAIVTYGSLPTQIKLHSHIKELISKEESSFSSWKKTALISTKEEVTAYGACVLAAKTDIDLSPIMKNIDVKPVSNTCVGVRITTKDDDDESIPIKVIFDFDRRIPAGPSKMEIIAAEFVAREILNKINDDDDELTEKEIGKYSGKNYIPQREKIAMKLKVQVYQKVQRDGIWIPVGDALKPLVKIEKKKLENNSEKNEEVDEEVVVACESSTLRLSLSENGVLTAAVVGNFESVVQALENSQYLKIRYYGILTTVTTLCIYFFIRAYWVEYTNSRDVKRLLHYYKIAAPNTFHDGDNWNARYLIWKYKGRRHVLWRRLEAKYDVPVPETWDGEDDDKDDEQDIDFDEMEEEEKKEKDEKDEF